MSFENSFSFSVSQGSAFRSCHRQYWYSRYGSWGGWLPDAEPETREAYRLKKLTNRYLWTGNRVHEAIKNVLSKFRAGLPFDPKQVRADLERLLQEDFAASAAHPKGEIVRDGKVVLIEQHHDDERISDKDWKSVIDRALTAIDGFFVSEAYKCISEAGPDALLRGDEKLESMPMTVKGVTFPVFVTIDVALKMGDHIVIMDWKTGKPGGEHEEQLGLYAIFARTVWNTSPDNIFIAPVYLAYTPQNLDLTQAGEQVMQRVQERLTQTVETILSRIDDPDKGIAHKEAFERTENTRTCQRCVYKSICRPGGV